MSGSKDEEERVGVEVRVGRGEEKKRSVMWARKEQSNKRSYAVELSH